MSSGSYETDGCVSPQCRGALSVTSSLPQGETFAKMTSLFHGGRGRTRKMRGGAASYPTSFTELLPQDMHAAADISSLDKAFAQLPEFAGKYGMSGGRRGRSSRRGRSMRGGVAPALQEGQSAMILSPAEEGQAFLNPQWYTENQVVPSFRGPASPYVASQKAGSRRRKGRKSRRTVRKMRGGRRNSACKASRKGRKASRKGRKASRKGRKASRKSRKASRKSRK